MTGYAAQERQALADALSVREPTAPTLCDGWDNRLLAAHVVMRERRPDAAFGVFLQPFSGYTDKVQQDMAKKPYSELVDLIRTGPPKLSLFSLPAVEEQANLLEFFVHCEDVRRGDLEWKPRELSPGLVEALWNRLAGGARLLLRKSPVPVRLVRPSGEEIATGGTGVPVYIRGEVGELMMYASGRRGAAQVEVTGEQIAVTKFEAADISM